MIARLRGVVDSCSTHSAIIDVGGVGYLVQCSAHTLSLLPLEGAPVVLEIETEMKEGSLSLFGFIDTLERDWFRLLCSVQGVGPRVALALLGTARPEALAQAILAQDKVRLCRAEGVGPKLAGRLVNELREKVEALALTQPAPRSAPKTPEEASPTAEATAEAAEGEAGTPTGTPTGTRPRQRKGTAQAEAEAAAQALMADAVSALVNLGYGRSEAFAAVTAARQGLATEGNAALPDLQGVIRAALKELAP